MKDETICVIHSFPIWLPQTQTWMYNQAKYLSTMIDTQIVCERTEHLDQFGLPNVHSLKDISKFRYALEKGLRLLLIRHSWGHLDSVTRKVQAQIIHSHFGHIGWADMLVANRRGAKHVVTFYGSDVNQLPVRDKKWKLRYHELFSSADLFLCEGPFMAARLKNLGCPENKIKVHHLGVEIGAIPYKPRFWDGNGKLRILIAASFREKKGIPYALEALAMLHKEVPLEITIIGDAGSSKDSQKEKQRIMDVINRRGLLSKTRFLGFQPYFMFFDEAYSNHIFVSPSVTASDGDTEGGAPVSIIEMIATGMPVISTTHCDIPEVVQYEIPGWLVEERDVSGLAERIKWLVEHREDWKMMTAKGRNHVEIGFDAERQGQRLSNLYYDLVVGAN